MTNKPSYLGAVKNFFTSEKLTPFNPLPIFGDMKAYRYYNRQDSRFAVSNTVLSRIEVYLTEGTMAFMVYYAIRGIL